MAPHGISNGLSRFGCPRDELAGLRRFSTEPGAITNFAESSPKMSALLDAVPDSKVAPHPNASGKDLYAGLTVGWLEELGVTLWDSCRIKLADPSDQSARPGPLRAIKWGSVSLVPFLSRGLIDGLGFSRLGRLAEPGLPVVQLCLFGSLLRPIALGTLEIVVRLGRHRVSFRSSVGVTFGQEGLA